MFNVGEEVDKSTPLLKVHTSSQNDFEKVRKLIENCFSVSEEKQNSLDVIYQTIS